MEEKLVASVPTDVQVTVTASPNKGLEQTFELAERLIGHGYDVVPHLAARMISGKAELAEIVERLTGAGVTTVFVPGGDADPVGDYHDSVALLEDLAALGSPFRQVGIAGYPESHPAIADDVTIQAMWDKRRHATHVVSNLTFDPKAITDWLKRMRTRGITMPLLVGLPGPVDRAKLLGMATKIGVGDSTRFLTKHKGFMAWLAAPGGFTGVDVPGQVRACAPGALVEGLHLYTFNQVAETEQWRQEFLGRLRD
ncbi:methylenetetrahydrofolate reductase [Phycicoccus sp.]|uniref:methylenetetrahydrofolate reductase n=1 Tax=Phycicoccus sp. TaxID=1902410 RepID=UPI00338DD316